MREAMGDYTAITIRHSSGLRAKVLTYGATLAELWTKDANGNLGDILLGHDDIKDWKASDFYAGATCGRYANRIRGAQFMLDGDLVQLEPNEGENQLHGGPSNFSHQNWQIISALESEVTLALTSPAGAMGFPATIKAEVTYRFDQDGKFWIEMRGQSDAPTVLNMANHAYFNLAGGGDILGHEVQIFADHYTPLGAGNIPTGEIHSVKDTPFDFREPRLIGQIMPDEMGFDQNLCLSAPLTKDWGEALRPCAIVKEKTTGRRIELRCNQPGLQLYTGGHLHGRVAGKSGAEIKPFSGFALETQLFPDSPNVPQFPSAQLMPGQVYRHLMAFDLTPVLR